MLYSRRAFLMLAGAGLVFGHTALGKTMPITSPIIDDLSREPPMATIGTDWRLFTDGAMGECPMEPWSA